MSRFDESLAVVLPQEGGFSDSKKDPGGRTMKGITQKAYNAYRCTKGLSLNDVKLISDAELHEIYREYWDHVLGDRLPIGLDTAVFDFAVNSGPGQATKELQRLVKVEDDGIMGSQTIAALPDDIESLIEQYSDARIAFMKTLKNFNDAPGWVPRVKAVETYAVKAHLAKCEPDTHPAPPVPFAPAATTALDSKQAEATPKAAPSGQVLTRTSSGVAGMIASASVVAPVVTGTAAALKPYVGHDLIGQGVLVVVVILTIIGGVFGGFQLLKPYLKQA